MMMAGANLGLSLTVNLEQYEDLAGLDDEAGIVVCTPIHSVLTAIHTPSITRLLHQSRFDSCHIWRPPGCFIPNYGI